MIYVGTYTWLPSGHWRFKCRSKSEQILRETNSSTNAQISHKWMWERSYHTRATIREWCTKPLQPEYSLYFIRSSLGIRFIEVKNHAPMYIYTAAAIAANRIQRSWESLRIYKIAKRTIFRHIFLFCCYSLGRLYYIYACNQIPPPKNGNIYPKVKETRVYDAFFFLFRLFIFDWY